MKNFPKVGDTVFCPADRGDAAYRGKITHVGTEIEINIHGAKYVWCSVKGVNRTSVWPSHRLGYNIV